jgi:hypothetical protein
MENGQNVEGVLNSNLQGVNVNNQNKEGDGVRFHIVQEEQNLTIEQVNVRIEGIEKKIENFTKRTEKINRLKKNFCLPAWVYWVWLISIIALGLSISSIFYGYNIKMDIKIVSTAIILGFVGILATFIVVSNYMQVKSVQDEMVVFRNSVQDEMNIVRGEIKTMEAEMNTIIRTIESKIDTKIGVSEVDAKMGTMESKIDDRIKITEENMMHVLRFCDLSFPDFCLNFVVNEKSERLWFEFLNLKIQSLIDASKTGNYGHCCQIIHKLSFKTIPAQELEMTKYHKGSLMSNLTNIENIDKISNYKDLFTYLDKIKEIDEK